MIPVLLFIIICSKNLFYPTLSLNVCTYLHTSKTSNKYAKFYQHKLLKYTIYLHFAHSYCAFYDHDCSHFCQRATSLPTPASPYNIHTHANQCVTVRLCLFSYFFFSGLLHEQVSSAVAVGLGLYECLRACPPRKY